MRQADLLAIADRALGLGARRFYDVLIEDAHAEGWDYESIARVLVELRSSVPELAEDINKFLEGIPLSPT